MYFPMRIILSDIRQFDNEDIFNEAFKKTSDDRKKMILSLKAPVDKKRSLAAGCLLDFALKESNLNGFKIQKGTHGKPFLPDAPNFHFNLSHSGSFALIAYADTPVGADIQQSRHIRDITAKRFLSEKEYGAMPSDESEKQHFLNKLWTIKEAYIKLNGHGLSCDMRSCTADILSHRIFDAYKTVFFRHFNFSSEDKDYNLSICSSSDLIPYRYEFFDFLSEKAYDKPAAPASLIKLL